MRYTRFEQAYKTTREIRQILQEKNLLEKVTSCAPWCIGKERCIVLITVDNEEALRQVAEALGLEIKNRHAEGLYRNTTVICKIGTIHLL